MLRMGLPMAGAGRLRVGAGESASREGVPTATLPPEDPAKEAERRAANEAARARAKMEREAAKLEAELTAVKKDLDERAKAARLGNPPPNRGGGAATERLHRRPATLHPQPPESARGAPRRAASPRGTMARRIADMEKLARKRGLVSGRDEGREAPRLVVRRDDPDDERQMYATYYRTQQRLPTSYRRQARGV